jgi:RHH-type proline utilization regulon transcriptional repressor/proline dehydrogenase/delta 1-pyrroline-5-carboxylate dehydrogenase
VHATTALSPDSGPFVFAPEDRPPSRVGECINPYYLADEADVVREILSIAKTDDKTAARIRETAEMLVQSVRLNRGKMGGMDALMMQYDLSSQEGVLLMCLAEALLRVPDKATADKLIADKLLAANWREHLGSSESVFVNASTWGLMLTGRIIRMDKETVEHPRRTLGAMITRAGEPVIRTAMRQAMKIMGHQFVMGRSIQDALKRSHSGDNAKFRYTFDMLGEAALTESHARQYFDAYCKAIDGIGTAVQKGQSLTEAPGISVKLSALFPRYEFSQRERVLEELGPRLLELALRAKRAAIGLTVDAEEMDRLETALELFEAVYRDGRLDGWNGFGLAMQTYHKRGLAQTRWLIDLARDVGRSIPVRLVKGAYWDAEIKKAQEEGLESYPVFTRKANTDVSYLACARLLLEAQEHINCQFATHNAQTVASIIHFAGDRRNFEFQRLHGMGEELYGEVIGEEKFGIPCRVYAPVGNHEDLLPYLVRRLLENGSNTSFVNRIVDESAPISEIVADPVHIVESFDSIAHPHIPLPRDIFGDQRVNSAGVNFADPARLASLGMEMSQRTGGDHVATPIVAGGKMKGEEIASVDPTDNRRSVGRIQLSSEEVIRTAIDVAAAAYPGWNGTRAKDRTRILVRAAELFEEHQAELLGLLVREAGKTLPDGVAELREAVDFLRYYGVRAARDFDQPRRMPGPTGESNELSLHGRGVFFCISPWNFPLAIFTGQVAAALAAGNTVLAKPAETTSLVAHRAVQLLHAAGVPTEVLQFLPGSGREIAGHVLPDPRIAGVAFTGSTVTAQSINRALAGRDGPIATLIAETGGQNVMLVDSSALPEQVVLDAVQSSLNSAGQRCSALRVMFLQEEIADQTIDLLRGYMKQLVIGDPAFLRTDIGPVIDQNALSILEAHAERITKEGRLIHRCDMSDETSHGTFFAPMAVEIDSLGQLTEEVFGPVLHIVRYRSSDLDDVIKQINGTGFGLTLGVHSRIDTTAMEINRKVSVGNVYVNRNMIGAVVGVQPFGGCGLSGTGPKAGGPHYLHRFAMERTLTINTSAVGGNTGLLTLGQV